MNLKMTAVLFVSCGLASQLFAGPIEQSQLATIDHEQATLTIVQPNGVEILYSAPQLEEFTTYSLTTTTPWRDQPAMFEGVLLSDILSKSGLDDSQSILVTAENDYQTTISKELLDSIQILVATRVDGQRHSRRNRGPIQFVIDAVAFENSPLTAESNLVWMAARIEAAN